MSKSVEPVAWYAPMAGEFAHVVWGKRPDTEMGWRPLYAAPAAPAAPTEPGSRDDMELFAQRIRPLYSEPPAEPSAEPRCGICAEWCRYCKAGRRGYDGETLAPERLALQAYVRTVNNLTGEVRAMPTAAPRADPAGDLCARLKLEAQIHAQEARTANATIAEIYQVISGATGEPGNWNGAEPVRQYVARAAATIKALQEERAKLLRAVNISLCAEDYLEWRQAEARVRELEQDVARMKPIYEAAIAWRNNIEIDADGDLCEAIDAARNQEGKV